jgi:AcrR family transcriptional regulator
MSKRTYTLKERARKQDETRRRIVEATSELHQEVGPANTTVAEIARRAGVQRLTVYNHFPTDAELFGACSAHWLERHPPPDPAAWMALDGPAERLRAAVGAFYARYAETETMTANVLRDAQLLPALAGVLQGAAAHLAAVTEQLLEGRRLRGRRRARVRAAIALALSFASWRTLVREQGLAQDEAVELAARAVEAA